MAFLYLTEQQSVLRKRGHRLIYEKNAQTLLDIPCHRVEAILIFGNVQITTQAMHEMFANEIEMAMFTRTGRLIGQLTSPLTKNIPLRIAQFRHHDNPDFCLEFARNVIAAKVGNGLQLVRTHSYNHPEIDLQSEIKALKSSILDISGSDSIPTLRGYEGTAARNYFGALSKMLRGPFTFPGRRHRPPTDPVNALLSLGYTLVCNEIASLLDGIGFDPYLGFLHEDRYGRVSLAIDLLEEFRAVVADRLALNLINNRVMTPDDFYPNPKTGGVQLTREAFKRFVEAYDKQMTQDLVDQDGESLSPRKMLRRQADRLARALENGHPYQPLQWGQL